MVKTALILISAPRWALEDCIGMPLFKRAILSAQKGGIEELYVAATRGFRDRLKALTSSDKRIRSTIHWLDGLVGLPERFHGPLIIIKAETVFDYRIIERMRRLELEDREAYVAVRGGVKASRGCQVKLKGDTLESAGEALKEAGGITAGLILVSSEVVTNCLKEDPRVGVDFCEIVKDLATMGKARTLDVAGDLCMEITSVEAMKEAKKGLYELQGLPTDGLVSVYLNRRLSKLLTRALIRIPLSPNHVTLIGFSIGLAACWFLWHGGYWYGVLGAPILYTSIIFDFADGEVARLKFMQSRLGGWMDTLCDSILYASVFLAITTTLYRETQAHYILWMGITAAIAVACCICIDGYLMMEKTRTAAKTAVAASNASFAWFLDKLLNLDSFHVALFASLILGRLRLFLLLMVVSWNAYLLVSLGRLLYRAYAAGINAKGIHR